ncbi:MAG: PD40 domain-containing protein [Acidobacteriota bacterium]|nr:MAG: PD40 domain-containing protein [Acidobacteriota bacterium]
MLNRRHPSLAALAALLIVAAVLSAGCGKQEHHPGEPAETTDARESLPRSYDPEPQEKHFSELSMLTDGGDNAEAYFSFDSSRLVFQTTRPPYECDQIMILDPPTAELRLVSTGLGRTTCGYFLPGDREIVYSSTHLGDTACPPPADRSRGYAWAVYDSYEVFRASVDDPTQPVQLTDSHGYDAEATVSPLGDRIVFTSTRDGDLDIYSMNLDGSDVTRLTDELGYDGGPFFSPDGKKIVYRARHPSDPEEVKEYESLLAEGLVRPNMLDVWVMNADGSGKRQVTDLPGASFAPFFHPSGEKIIFSSNHHDPNRREFDLFMVGLDGEGLEQITYSEGFDGFPMFSPNGEWFVFCSNRHNSKPRETNVFLTRWRDSD